MAGNVDQNTVRGRAVSSATEIQGGGLPGAGRVFIGREEELAQLGALLTGATRLVTLVGPGGIGKTWLAEEAARRLQRAHRTPVWCVRLASVSAGAEPAAVREAVTAAVLVGGFAGASAWDGAVHSLSSVEATGRPRDALLILDNCEHVPAVGTVITQLLHAVPGLTIMATSRQPLGCVDEVLVTVPPLSAEQSAELFCQRAELTGHSIREPEQPLVHQVCAHMHGHPLFIRLAAARMFYEPLPMLLKQLTGESEDARMRWRHGPRAGLDGRHQSVSDAIAWSYDLCAPKERILFERLSVFAPGFDADPGGDAAGAPGMGAELDAIEVVCADDVAVHGCDSTPGAEPDTLARSEIRDLLQRLVDRSLVSVHGAAGAERYSLLESMRLFAADKLAERSGDARDEPARSARRHCFYYRDKVVQPQSDWFGPAEQDLLNWAMGAWANIRRAIDTSMQTVGDPAVGLQICAGLLSLRAPFFLGSLPEIRSRIEQTLAAARGTGAIPTELEIAAMAQIAWLAVYQGRSVDAEKYLEHCVAACDSHDGPTSHWRDEPDVDRGFPAVVEFAWGAELMLVRRDRRAIVVLTRAREKFRALADRGGEAMSGMFEALAAGFYGTAQEAMASSQRQLESTTAAGAAWARSWAQLMMAIALTKHGEPAEALALVRAALTYQLPMGDQWGTTWAVHIQIWALARSIRDQMATGQGDQGNAGELATEIAHLAGGVKTQRARLGVLIENMGPFADETGAAIKIARDVLGEAAYAYAERRGSRLSPERFAVQRLALGALSIETSPAETTETSTWSTLSAAESEVAILAAAGWPNSAIAVRRGTSTRTTDAQLSSVFRKLLINSREDIVRCLPEDQRHQVAAEVAQQPDRVR